jgi:hypothetical protein
MNTYLLSIPESLKSFHEKINVKRALCGKTWRVLTQESEKVVLIFQEEGKIIVSKNGEAIKSSWEYIEANKSILVEIDSKQVLSHPTFIDDVLFILQQDGTDKCIIMVDENKIDKLMLISLEAIKKYLYRISGEEEKERLEKEKERQAYRSYIAEKHWEEIEVATKPQRRLRKIILGISTSVWISFFISLITGRINLIMTLFYISVAIGTVLIVIWFVMESIIDSIEKSIVDKYFNE